MALRIGDTAPNFKCQSTKGDIDWHEHIKGSWAILCSHPKDFTPVCTTEVGTLGKMSKEWADRNTKVAVVSVDSAEEHVKWVTEIERCQGCTIDYPLLGDETKKIAQLYGMLDQTHLDDKGMPLTVRSVFIIAPDTTIKLIITYPASCGRNFDEVLRVLDSLQLTAYQKCATPANWTQGSKVCLLPTMSDDEAKTYEGLEVTSALCKLRLVPQPTKPDTMCTVHPYFTVLDREKALAVMAEFVVAAGTEAGCLYYGWTMVGDQLFCREAYADGAAVNAHLANVGPLLDKMLDNKYCKLHHIEIHGPAADLALVKPGTEALGTVYYEFHSGFSNVAIGATATPYSLCTIHPYFTVLNQEKALEVMAEFIPAAKKEAGCLYYGWTMVGDKLFCREAYADGAAVNAHLANVGPLLGKMLDNKYCKLDKIEIHGPAADLAICKPGTEALGTVYYETHSGFKKF